jgi:fatty acid desaturase
VPGKLANHLFGNIFFALPVGQTVRSYAVSHVLHHTKLNSEQDPAFFITNPKLSKRRVAWILLSLLLGRVIVDLAIRTYNGRRADASIKTGNAEKVVQAERQRAWLVFVYHAPIILIAVWFNAILLWVVWVLCAVCIVPFLDGLRSIVEHRRGANDAGRFHTRSHHTNPLVSAMFAPFFQYHWEHHAAPGIPHCRLRRLHRLLLASEVPGAHAVRGGFWGGFRTGLMKP